MRTFWLMACILNAACANHLARGDVAFAQRQWESAAEEWNAVGGHDDEVALRLALLHASPGSTLYDPARSEQLFEFVRAQWPDTPAGTLAQLWIDLNARRAQAAARIEVLEATARFYEKLLTHLQHQATIADEAAAAELEQAHERQRGLQAEIERLRAQLEAATSLEEENDALREELEALKSIDFRR